MIKSTKIDSFFLNKVCDKDEKNAYTLITLFMRNLMRTKNSR